MFSFLMGILIIDTKKGQSQKRLAIIRAHDHAQGEYNMQYAHGVRELL